MCVYVWGGVGRKDVIKYKILQKVHGNAYYKNIIHDFVHQINLSFNCVLQELFEAFSYMVSYIKPTGGKIYYTVQ